MNKWTEKLIREHTIMEIAVNDLKELFVQRELIITDPDSSGRECEEAKNMYDEVKAIVNWVWKKEKELDNEYYGSEQR